MTTRHRSLRLMVVTALLCGGGLLLLFGLRVPRGVIVVLVVAGLMLLLALLHRASNACDAAPPALRRRYTRELALGMGVYVLMVFVSVWLLKQVDDALLRAVIALLPVPPVALVVRAMIRYVRDADEMQRRIELEAVSIATAFVSLLYMSGGFLQAARVIDLPASAAMIWLLPLVCLGYGVAKALVMRRYQ
ncbi:hypothetical protein BH23PSE2_BH23PSE2_05890 [soil metagenome]